MPHTRKKSELPQIELQMAEYDDKPGLLLFEEGIGIAPDMVVIRQLSGEGKFWKQVAEILAEERGIKNLGSWLLRNVEGYIKFYGVEVDKVEEKEKEFKRYYGHFKDTGKKILLTPQGKISNGNIRYVATWEI